MALSASRWWTRRCGGRELMALALPLVVSTASWTVMNFIDRMFLLWYDKTAMAAAMPAGMLFFAILCFPLGISLYVNTFVAQYYGAGRLERIGEVVGQGIYVALIATPIFMLLAPMAPWLFRWAGHPPSLATPETLYFQTLMFCAPAWLVASVLSSFFTGRGQTRVVMVVDSAGALLNVVLDAIMIFGHFGLSSLGIEGIAGAAWATVIAQWAKTIVYWALIHRAEFRQTFGIDRLLRWNRQLMGRLLYYGGPNGLTMFIEIAGFTGFILIVARLGEEPMAATTLAFNVNSMAFVPLFGLGIALSTMVGQQQGRGRHRLAARATWTALAIGMAYSGIFAAMYVVTPDLFLFGHQLGTTPEEFAHLRDITVVLLRFVAAYCLFDTMAIIFSSAIKGAGDTRFVLLTSLFTAPLPVFLGWWGVTREGWGLLPLWVIITVWISVLGLLYMGRFLQGSWRTMQVIEPDQALPAETAIEDSATVAEPVG